MMKELTLEQLKRAIPAATSENLQRFLEPINDAMARYDIDTPLRAAHFLCQIAWESGSLRYTEEIASGAAYDQGRLAAALGNTPAKDGDGQRYKGRGLIQVTGRTNYRLYGYIIGKDMEDEREQNWLLLREPQYAADSAGWFWKSHHLNERADRDEHTNITRIINGSTVTAPKRLPYLRNAKIALGLIKG
jgi:putative chitinase